MNLYKITIDVENWLPNTVIEIVRATNKLEAINKIKNSFVYSRQDIKIINVETI